MSLPGQAGVLLQDVLVLQVLGLACLSSGDGCAVCQVKLSAFAKPIKVALVRRYVCGCVHACGHTHTCAKLPMWCLRPVSGQLFNPNTHLEKSYLSKLSKQKFVL